MIQTKAVTGRRELSFDTLRAALRDAESFGAKGPSRTLGNWTAAQIVEHVAITIDFSVDGFPPEMRPGLPLRLLGRLMKKSFVRNRMKPGFTLPRKMQAFLPSPDVSWGRAMDHLRRAIDRFEKAGALSNSPFLGTMSREDWVNLHRHHAEMHFSFMG
ncbi:MAG: DUF1569 domain-containing protein [Phycisphaerales bacterium]